MEQNSHRTRIPHPQLTLPAKPAQAPRKTTSLRTLERAIQNPPPENGASQADADARPHRDPLPPLPGTGLHHWLRRAAILLGLAAVTLLFVVLNVSRNGRLAEPKKASGEIPGVEQPAQVAGSAAAIEQREKQLIADLLNGATIGSEPVDAAASRVSSNIDAAPDSSGTTDIVWPSAAPAVFEPPAAVPAAPPPPSYVYAATRLSIVHENGVAGIPQGARLAVLERRGENLLVSFKGHKGEVLAVDTREKP